MCEENDQTLLDRVAREVFEECGQHVSRCIELMATDAWDIPRPDLGLTYTLMKYTFLSKKRLGLSTKAEREGQELAEEIKYIGIRLL